MRPDGSLNIVNDHSLEFFDPPTVIWLSYSDEYSLKIRTDTSLSAYLVISSARLCGLSVLAALVPFQLLVAPPLYVLPRVHGLD